MVTSGPTRAAVCRVVDAIKDGRLVLTRIPIDPVQPGLNSENREILALARQRRIMGKQAIKILPYALWWFEKHRQRVDAPLGPEIWSTTETHRVHLGRPTLALVQALFESKPKLKRQCLIPSLRREGPNELLVFEREPEWEVPETG